MAIGVASHALAYLSYPQPRPLTGLLFVLTLVPAFNSVVDLHQLQGRLPMKNLSLRSDQKSLLHCGELSTI
jgi:hypothetical protein